MDTAQPFVSYLVVALLGLSIGSFLNVCIYRLPLKKAKVYQGRSHCPKCKKAIAWYDNLPLASYAVLGGKCRHCRKPISAVYPVVEFVTASLFLFCFWRFGLGWMFLSSIVLTACLIVISAIDLKYKIIPDVISLPGIILGLGFSFLIPGFNWLSSLIGVLVGGVFFYLLAAGGEYFFKKEALGGGDIKLAAMLGAFLGWKKLILVFFLSSLLGLLASVMLLLYVKRFRRERIIPFGPFLSLASLVALFAGDALIRFYVTRFLQP